MKVGSILENQNLEKRIAVTPEIVKKYTSLGFEILLSKNYGLHLGINDKEFLDLGAKISNDENEILSNSDIIIQLGMLSDDKSALIKENQNLIGVFNPYENKIKLENLSKKKINVFSLEKSYSKNTAIKTKTNITATVPHRTNFVKLFQVFLWSLFSIKNYFCLALNFGLVLFIT